MGRLINIDPAHSRRPSKMVITKRRAELKYKPPGTRYPHPSQASVDHPGPSNTALRHGANLQARSARQSQPSSVVVNSDPTGRHPRNISGLVATQPPPSLPSCPPALPPSVLSLSHGEKVVTSMSSQAPSVHHLPCADSTPRESECLEVGWA